MSSKLLKLQNLQIKEFEDIKDKVKKTKNISSILKHFKFTSKKETNNNNDVKVNLDVTKSPVATTWPIPPECNDTIVDAEINNEVVVLPPSPQKELKREISSQILPLSRLSLSSSNGSGNSPPANQNPQQTELKSKLTKLRKSLAEPIFQYLQGSTPNCEDEPEALLNTPKSLQNGSGNGINIIRANKKGRALFSKSNSQDEPKTTKQYENLPPIIITDM